jgi:hypothetical protein
VVRDRGLAPSGPNSVPGRSAPPVFAFHSPSRGRTGVNREVLACQIASGLTVGSGRVAPAEHRCPAGKRPHAIAANGSLERR